MTTMYVPKILHCKKTARLTMSELKNYTVTREVCILHGIWEFGPKVRFDHTTMLFED